MLPRHLLQASPWTTYIAIPLALVTWWGAGKVHRLHATHPAPEMLSVSAAIAAGGETSPRSKHRRIGVRPGFASSRILAVSSPLDGRVVEVMEVTTALSHDKTSGRSLRTGDHVTRGQVLARLWSPELGEKKSRFLAASSRLLCDQEALENLDFQNSSPDQRAEAQRHCDADQVALVRAESALRDLQFQEHDLEELRTAANQLHQGTMDYARSAHWAEWELRSPADGIVVESRLEAGAAVESASVLCVISTGETLEARAKTPAAAEALLLTASPAR